MKSLSLRHLVLPSFLVGALVVRAQTVTNFTFDGINAAIPDGDLSGLVDSRSVTLDENSIQNLTVQLTISATGDGAYNGDFYAYLQHGSEIAILLNRPGRRSDDSFGYDDDGLANVTFDDAAPNGDIHTYRLTLFGDHDTPVPPAPSALTGTWAPDGREVNPGIAFDTSPRTATLNRFNGLDPTGAWTLFLADHQVGGTARLDSWALNIIVVPEPGEAAMLLTGLLVLGLAAWRRALRLRRAD